MRHAICFWVQSTEQCVFDLPKLCLVVELVVPILKDGNYFSIQRTVFSNRAHRKLRGYMTYAQFLSNNSVSCEARQI